MSITFSEQIQSLPSFARFFADDRSFMGTRLNEKWPPEIMTTKVIAFFIQKAHSHAITLGFFFPFLSLHSLGMHECVYKSKITEIYEE